MKFLIKFTAQLVSWKVRKIIKVRKGVSDKGRERERERKYKLNSVEITGTNRHTATKRFDN